MSEIGTATVKVKLDWSGVADDLRAMADRIDPQDHTAPLVSTDDRRTIPWPPSDELVKRVARTLHGRVCNCPGDEWADYKSMARAVLNVIGSGSGE